MIYITMYALYIYDYDMLQRGFALIPIVLGMIFTSIDSGMAVTKIGYRIWIIIGSVLTAASLPLMSTVGSDSDLIFVMVYLSLFGLVWVV